MNEKAIDTDINAYEGILRRAGKLLNQSFSRVKHKNDDTNTNTENSIYKKLIALIINLLFSSERIYESMHI